MAAKDGDRWRKDASPLSTDRAPSGPGLGCGCPCVWQMRKLWSQQLRAELGSGGGFGLSSEVTDAPWGVWAGPSGLVYLVGPWHVLGAGRLPPLTLPDSRPRGAPPPRPSLAPRGRRSPPRFPPAHACVYVSAPDGPAGFQGIYQACVCFSCVGFEMISLNKI